MLNRKSRIDDFSNIINQDPIQRLVQIWIDSLNIIKHDGFVQEHFVEGSSKAAINMMAMENGSTDDSTDEMKIGQVIGIDTTVGIDLERVDIIPEKGLD